MALGTIQSAAFELLRRDASDPDDTEDPDASQKEVFSSWALLILIVLLIVAFFTSYVLQSKKIQAVHETVVSIFAGMVVGLILRLTVVTSVLDAVSFDYQFFFNLLLPPIILASGYELHQVGLLERAGQGTTTDFLKGQLLPQHWNHLDLRFRWNVYICIGAWRDSLAMDTHSAGRSGHQFCRSYERWRNFECYGSCDDPRHLHHLQGRSEALHHHLWRVHSERCYRHCLV